MVKVLIVEDSPVQQALIGHILSTDPDVMVIGTVASKRNNNARAIEYWSKAAEISAKDTSYRDVRRQMLANIGSSYLTTANMATGAEKVAAAR